MFRVMLVGMVGLLVGMVGPVGMVELVVGMVGLVGMVELVVGMVGLLEVAEELMVADRAGFGQTVSALWWAEFPYLFEKILPPHP
ncbi:MAG: hypothetical protein A6F71_10395 [Cycloclasticus sp. symbiont of Poecilosclerida sp. M]|nr:MAG: hypothetical protein A6F71_10395 [Cycloclasticus sp. symbiont of Poecilosclerida sp. M]